MASTEGSPPFSSLRTFLWPVHRHELRKLVPMLLIFFLLTFDYNVLRCMKDSFVITAEHSGAEVIPFIKVWVMFPMSLLLTYVFIRLANRCRYEYVFYWMLSTFLGFFLLFACVLYPARDALHPTISAAYLQEILPVGCKGFVAMYRYWTYTSFYVMSELWSNIILSLLFWGFANQVTRLDEAKRFYGLFGVGVNVSGVASGQISILIAQLPFNPNLPLSDSPWAQTSTLLVLLVLAAGIASMVIFRWLHRNVLSQEAPEQEQKRGEPNQGKPRLSMRENVRFLLRSRYILYIALVIMCYNLVINLVEVLWKHEVSLLYPLPTDYNIYMNQVTTIIGIIATLTSLFISGNSIRTFGWTATALITPAILFLTSVGFFTCFFMKQHPDVPQYLFGIGAASLLPLSVFFGSMQNCCSRAAKYTVFDATKEMAFVPLSQEDKVKGKAAIDGIFNRLGKSGGSIIYQGLFLACSTVSASAPYVAVALFITIAVWISCTTSLGKRFNQLTKGSVREEDGRVLASASYAT